MDEIVRNFADINSIPDFREVVDSACLQTADSLDEYRKEM